MAGNISPRHQSAHGHAGTGGLPLTHNIAIKSSTTSNSSKYGNPQHRTQSIEARLSRSCPSLIHGPPRRRRNIMIMIFAGGVVSLIFFLSTWNMKISSSVFSKSSVSSSSSSQSNQHLAGNTNNPPLKDPVAYTNPDGSAMNPKSIFMIRDFGSSACKKEYEGKEHTLPEETRRERDLAQSRDWGSITRANAWTMSLAWKRSLKQMLPNWKEYSIGWVGQGVVLGAFPDGDGKQTVSSTLNQIKLIRSISSIPIEVWFERADDVSEELHEALASWGATIRSLDNDASLASDAIVQSSDNQAAVGPLNTPISNADIQVLKSGVGRNLAQLQKAMTVAALINSGFEDIIYFSPSTLPMQSPKLVFQHPEYIQKGAVFWQHPSSFPAYDSPIWPIIQSDCTPGINEQSWSSFALRHKDSWKGLFLTWHWLAGSELETYERIFGRQGNDILRAAWLAVGRPFIMVDRMPQAGLLDLSQYKGEGIGCNTETTLYPAFGADILQNPSKYMQDQAKEQRLFKQSYRYGKHGELFLENSNIMMLDAAPDSSIVRAGSYSQPIHKSIEREVSESRNPARMVLTDAYSAGPDGRVCLKISRKSKGHHHE
ncbi:hypothetical protein BGZ49_007359 [Haplosporangium sp. Z 27]|nr:hypothetical protein BGZ49_007359 [Haplosporangium sp. Z 27]